MKSKASLRISHRVDRDDCLQVPLDHQGVGNAVGGLHPVLESDSGESAVVGTAHQGADFLDVDQDGHVAALAGEPPFARELAIEDEPDDFLACAAALLGCVQNVSLAGSGRLHGIGTVQQAVEEGVQVLGRELVGCPVIRSADPWDDQTGPVQHVQLHPGRVEVFAGFADREGRGRGFLGDRGAALGVEQALAGKKPLMVIVDEQVIEDSKVAAVLDKRKVSGTVQELLQGWLAGRKSRK